ncbi:MAG: hypothetical protein ACREQZ_14645 [Woeseiaceae bacterium]
MNRSPYGHALARAFEADAGGVADLQTDVMRFMAILSLCLVAIFALVQSLPLGPAPAQRPVEAPKVETPVRAPVKLPVAASTPPAPQRTAPRRPEPQRRAPEPETAPVAQSLAPAAPQGPGFTLQFETDRALTRLVERQVVGLYAQSGERTQRLRVDAGRMSFWPASAPQAFHEMDASTVPADVRRALAVAGVSADAFVQWGVTLPPATSAQLERHLREATGGRLIIDAGGDLRREH